MIDKPPTLTKKNDFACDGLVKPFSRSYYYLSLANEIEMTMATYSIIKDKVVLRSLVQSLEPHDYNLTALKGSASAIAAGYMDYENDRS